MKFVQNQYFLAEIFNKRLFPAIGVHKVKEVLRGSKIIDPEERKGMLDFLADWGIMLVCHIIPIAEDVLGITIDERKYSDEYLDTPIAQLAISQPDAFQMSSDTDDIQEHVVTVAKRLLRQGTAEAKVHV
ncbi:hypothetical protein [Paenibacillus alvei]|uniref:Uncharacterized protein n=1 Tax=Paenibacillus alvei TaxID=44250 RepID=A0AAP7A7U7_PAEAL|nr:hypothetical protein [Paenibacillus alvei]NOJ74117.1 hypothetical protein [Paenibacillus alvei]